MHFDEYHPQQYLRIFRFQEDPIFFVQSVKTAYLHIQILIRSILQNIYIQAQGKMNRPKTLVCYICGREFGTKSLAIHIKSCEKKWANEENLKPPKQRRPCPKPPAGLNQFLGKPNISKQDVNDYNTDSYNTFKDEALIQCEYCGRRFNPKSLAPHQKACKTNPMIRKPYVGKNLAKVEEESPQIKVTGKQYQIPSQAYDQGSSNLVPCKKCSRTFASDRVSKHEKICKGVEKKTVPTISQKYQIKQASKPQLGKKVEQKKSKWKIQSEQLQNAMKQNRKMKDFQQKGGNLADLPPPPKSNYDHYVQCRYCGRNFAPEVAEKHVPKCANIVNKPGGIKPSKIQEKYIGTSGTNGAVKSKIQGSSSLTGGISGIKPGKSTLQQPVKNATKPMMSRKR